MDYPCTGNEEVFPNIELVDAEGNVVNNIVSSECFAGWYAPLIGCTWRHPLPPVVAPEGEDA